MFPVLLTSIALADPLAAVQADLDAARRAYADSASVDLRLADVPATERARTTDARAARLAAARQAADTAAFTALQAAETAGTEADPLVVDALNLVHLTALRELVLQVNAGAPDALDRADDFERTVEGLVATAVELDAAGHRVLPTLGVDNSLAIRTALDAEDWDRARAWAGFCIERCTDKDTRDAAVLWFSDALENSADGEPVPEPLGEPAPPPEVVPSTVDAMGYPDKPVLVFSFGTSWNAPIIPYKLDDERVRWRPTFTLDAYATARPVWTWSLRYAHDQWAIPDHPDAPEVTRNRIELSWGVRFGKIPRGKVNISILPLIGAGFSFGEQTVGGQTTKMSGFGLTYRLEVPIALPIKAPAGIELRPAIGRSPYGNGDRDHRGSERYPYRFMTGWHVDLGLTVFLVK